jgi:hypothetical protein
MAKKTFYIVNGDPTEQTCVPRYHPHEAAFRQGQVHNLQFKNLTTFPLSLSFLSHFNPSIMVELPPYDERDANTTGKVDIKPDREGCYSWTTVPVRTCPQCGHKFGDGAEIKLVSGGSESATGGIHYAYQLRDGGGDPIIIIDPEA